MAEMTKAELQKENEELKAKIVEMAETIDELEAAKDDADCCSESGPGCVPHSQAIKLSEGDKVMIGAAMMALKNPQTGGPIDEREFPLLAGIFVDQCFALVKMVYAKADEEAASIGVDQVNDAFEGE